MKQLDKIQKRKKLRLGRYPYTYSRISALKGKLIKRDDYNRLLKMKSHEIAKFMQETEYKKEIDELAGDFSGTNLIEMALNKNLTSLLMKLRKISEKNMIYFLDAYLKRKDIDNIKTILRGKFTDSSEDEIKNLLVPAGSLSVENLHSLIKKESIEDIVKAVRFTDLTEGLNAFRENNSLFAIENQLNKHYYEDVMEFTKRMPKEGSLFRKFLENEIDTLNIETILRLKKEGMPNKEIQKHLLYPGARLKKQTLIRLSNTDSISDIISKIKKMGYIEGDINEDKIKKEGSMMEVEIELNRHLLKRAMLMLHQHPLSVDVILGYMFAKEIEVRNLKIIIKGKQLELDEDFITKELVIGA